MLCTSMCICWNAYVMGLFWCTKWKGVVTLVGRYAVKKSNIDLVICNGSEVLSGAPSQYVMCGQMCSVCSCVLVDVLGLKMAE
jgi:hypothetical protein